jgi:hypothetical protein
MGTLRVGIVPFFPTTGKGFPPTGIETEIDIPKKSAELSVLGITGTI